MVGIFNISQPALSADILDLGTYAYQQNPPELPSTTFRIRATSTDAGKYKSYQIVAMASKIRLQWGSTLGIATPMSISNDDTGSYYIACRNDDLGCLGPYASPALTASDKVIINNLRGACGKDGIPCSSGRTNGVVLFDLRDVASSITPIVTVTPAPSFSPGLHEVQVTITLPDLPDSDNRAAMQRPGGTAWLSSY